MRRDILAAVIAGLILLVLTNSVQYAMSATRHSAKLAYWSHYVRGVEVQRQLYRLPCKDS